ncbi:DNA mismatch repair endonuclease MutL [Coprococcus phoceensis]|uniref:DNA mismatch repair endonuclease MutL n=1 Tax=Coprococcus phoceensis TaxID=1870993 RepID=UPI0008D9248C|nr:DNA mismatch repair endonuclease MutL [Coprococcus phoceensis]HCX06190.1 DNA mismatch repair endonuclease MutL [Clostridium sp.]
MVNIQVLDQITIDKIAAGEVIERPASIIKELVENAIDAGASAVTVEIKEGGISFIRITDNGCGIPKGEVPLAFLRHSTSKIRSVDDLSTVASLGFRGEALSSIAAIAQVELITKTKDEVTGTRYRIEGGAEKSIEDTGAPDGTTFLVHQIFYNTPARRKFLKTPMTEASHVSELMTRLALSHPEVSIQFINNGQEKLHTSGNGKLKDIIYHVFGRDIANNLLETNERIDGIQVQGFIGKPIISRGNRNYENYFINGRYVKSNIIAKAIEDAYKDFTMQHKYPFTALHFTMDGTDLDVNVHPTKMELRFSNQQGVYNFIYNALKQTLSEPELIPRVELPEAKEVPVKAEKIVERKQEQPMTPVREERKTPVIEEEKNLDYFMKKMRERVTAYHQQVTKVKPTPAPSVVQENVNYEALPASQVAAVKQPVPEQRTVAKEPMPEQAVAPREQKSVVTEKQLDFFEEKLLTKKAAQEYKIIGQLFETYWLVEFHEQLYIIDQHAAHERVLYEKTLRGMKDREFTSQYLSPPIILNLSMQEEEALNTHMDIFTNIGFEIEPFGGDSYAIRAVPDNLFSIAKRELFTEMLDQLVDGIHSSLAPDIVAEKVASMSCKAAVKGNSRLSAAEVETLIGELLELENPYHCPHGRPTIIAMTKRELEKKFKRIV